MSAAPVVYTPDNLRPHGSLELPSVPDLLPLSNLDESVMSVMGLHRTTVDLSHPDFVSTVCDVAVPGNDPVEANGLWDKKGSTRKAVMSVWKGKDEFKALYNVVDQLTTLTGLPGTVCGVFLGFPRVSNNSKLPDMMFFNPVWVTLPDDGVQLPCFEQEYVHYKQHALHWPGAELFLQCPVCRNRAKPGETEVNAALGISMSRRYIMALQYFQIPHRKKDVLNFTTAQRQRLFCVPCFAKVAETVPAGAGQMLKRFLEGIPDPMYQIKAKGTEIPPPTRVLPAFEWEAILTLTGYKFEISNFFGEVMRHLAGQGRSGVPIQQTVGSPAGQPILSPCSFCGKNGAEKKCSACSRAHYCTQDCQRGHWKDHRADCQKWKAAKKQ